MKRDSILLKLIPVLAKSWKQSQKEKDNGKGKFWYPENIFSMDTLLLRILIDKIVFPEIFNKVNLDVKSLLL